MDWGFGILPGPGELPKLARESMEHQLKQGSTPMMNRCGCSSLILLRIKKESPSQGCSNSFDLESGVQCRRAFFATLGIMKEAVVDLASAWFGKAMDSKPTGF